MSRAGSLKRISYEDANLDTRTSEAYVSVASPLAVPIELAVYENLAEVENDWRTFERQADCTVFQTFDWLATWQRHVGALGGVQPAIVVGRAGGDVLFILPLAIQKIGFARELVWLGSDLCDYNAPLLAPQFCSMLRDAQFREIWRRIVEMLQKRPALHYDIAHLVKMPAIVGAQANPMLERWVTLNPSGAYSTPLAESWEIFYAAKRPSTIRRTDRRKRRRLAELGTLTVVHPREQKEALAALNTLIAQKSRALLQMGAGNLFARPGYSEFYRALATDSRTQSLVHISHLNCGPDLAAVDLGLIFRGTYYLVLASYDAGELSRFSPGTAHLHELLRYAIDRKLTTFDFTIGDESYKRDWCDGPQKLYDHLSAATWRGIFVVVPFAAKLWLKRQIKQTPMLWRPLSEARKLYGSLRHGVLPSKAKAPDD